MALEENNLIMADADARADVVDDPKIKKPHKSAVGIEGATRGMYFGVREFGVLNLLDLNRHNGVKCPGCAWPNPSAGKGGFVDFCENGAKAVAEESTARRCTPDFFAAHPFAELRDRTDYELSHEGRLTAPVIKRPGSDHYEPITWEAAFDAIGDQLKKLDPNECAFYTSGRTCNETAYMFQVLAKRLGTNNLPDCSNMCHEASGKALIPTLGLGKGSVTLEDFAHADLVITLGQNPGTNHPRQLGSFAACKENGGKIVVINPLPEAGLRKFRDPQTVNGLIGTGTPIADEFYQIRLDGDLAFFQAVNQELIKRDALDHEFLDKYTTGQEEVIEHLKNVDPDMVRKATGLPDESIQRVADLVEKANGVIVCWALGATQHKNSVETLQEIVNMLLLTGNIGKPGAGTCPVRGHSNVQGDRTMGVWEEPPESLCAALEKEFQFPIPREHGWNVVETGKAIRDGRCKFFMQMGGNFLRAASDTAVLEKHFPELEMTVHVSTKLNRSHIYPGKTSIILPTLTRSDAFYYGNEQQCVTTEDSMGYVTASYGKRRALDHLLSETYIIGEIGHRIGGENCWRQMGRSTKEIRRRIENTIPGFENFEQRLTEPNGLILPNGPRERKFTTKDGKAHLTVNNIEPLECPPGHVLLQTLRSHDQYNTTIYALSDRYRGIKKGRRVVLINEEDIKELGFQPGDVVDLYSDWDGTTRYAPNFRLVPYNTPRQCAAAYMPEANVLIALDNECKVSQTPVMKSVLVYMKPAKNSGKGGEKE
ncbi:FdhF/YdeP family oxidoreductase [Winkia neuii]|uniref:FdhF/YdeP family oxidoreductase n=1 Tax=Winkia neuii subsp. anitrata TaxID=29318 RepID=A0AB38XNP4_9ACTO|nr:FdhF/YdeP family oxidoreductase [Winkia neuii]WCE45898.1 FdhF/YdeP family oxidoreductase [Winkia neuii subsp. anitrata]